MNILITGAWQQAFKHIEELEEMGNAVKFLQYEKDALPCTYEWVEGIIGNGIFLTHPIEKFTNLHYIQLTSAGFDRVPMAYVQQHNIEIRNARGVYSIPMAEYALTGVLCLYKQLRFFAKEQELHQWEKHRGLFELYGKTVLIIGCGSVGTECAKRFQAFGCNVIGVDKSSHTNSNFSHIVKLDELETHLPSADVVVLALPLTEETKHLMNCTRLTLLKKTSILVNIARGSIIDTDALIKVLPNIGGAVLDVFEQEPLNADSPLWNMNNVLITPHNSFSGDGNPDRLDNVILSGLYEKSGVAN